MTRVVVVGGGITGLVAAWDLCRAGYDVELIEAADRVGGPLLTGEVGGVVVDLGAESFLRRRPEAVDLVDDLGLAVDIVSPTLRAPLIHRDGTGHPLPPGTVFGVPDDPARLAGLLTTDEIARARHERTVAWSGDVSVAEFVGCRLGAAVVDRVVDPLLGGVYAGSAARLSAQAALPTLVAAVRDGTSLTAAVTAVRGRTGSAPGSTAGHGVFSGIAGGVGRLAHELRDAVVAAGGRVTPGEPVVALRAGGGAWLVTSQPAAGDSRSRTVAAVVLATPARVSAALLAQLAPGAAAQLCAIQSADVAVVALALPATALPPGGGSGVLLPAVEGRRRGLAVKALTFSSSKWDWVAAQDPAVAVIRASIGRAGEADEYHRSDAELISVATRDVRLLLDIDTDVAVSDAVVARWPAALPQYPVGHVSAMARVRSEVEAHHGLAIAGSMLDGVGIPACIATGRAAASKVVIDLAGRSSLDQLRGGPRVKEDTR